MKEQTSKIIKVAIGENYTVDWSVEGDKKALLLSRNGISTKLKLARPFVVEDGKDKLNEMLNGNITGITDEENKVYFTSSDFIPFDMSISKENYNILLRKKKEEGEVNSLLIIDMSTNVMLLRYMSNFEIANSYHSDRKAKNSSYGCFIKLPSEVEAETELCRIQTFENKKFYQYIITMNDIKKFEINKPSSVGKLKKIKESMTKHRIQSGFKVTPKVFPTKFIVSAVKDEDNMGEELNTIRSFVTEKFPEVNDEPLGIILVPRNQTNQGLIEDLKDILADPEYSNGITIKAITTYEYKFDYEVIKAMKFNYIFSLDETGKLKTLKSN